MYLLKYACLPLGHLNTKLLCARDCLNCNVLVFRYLFTYLWKDIFTHQTTSDNQQLKESLKELKGA